ncbi:Sulfite reductase [NADPH] flavoprotein alpha-component [Escherichia coli IS25]|nr:Sulfite reductase [NADPH] flavoprotein alpha-component [Escherichia coli IS25]
MTTQVPPSALLPLNPEQLARLQAATTDLTPTQLAWVSGYFWGVLNQQLLRLQRRQRQPQKCRV